MNHYEPLDRHALKIQPLACRRNKAVIERDSVGTESHAGNLSIEAGNILEELVEKILLARESGRPRMLAMGAHTIKNGLAPVLIRLMGNGWITHVATNGAGIIHDWEFAYQGESSEDVRENVALGQFGIWEETGYYINLAIIVGSFEGLGYGDSVGKFIEKEGLNIPSEDTLRKVISELPEDNLDQAASAIGLLKAIREFNLEPGWLSVSHPFKKFSVQAAANRLGIPFTGHPMIGHDIIYCHPMNNCASIGRAAERDFLKFAGQVCHLSGGVFISLGSAVMAPMVFEKSLSMAQNLAIQKGNRVEDHYMAVVDLQSSHWDWSKGEPPSDDPDYYLRYCKSFSRMGGTMRYIQADNRDFLVALLHRLASQGQKDGSS